MNARAEQLAKDVELAQGQTPAPARKSRWLLAGAVAAGLAWIGHGWWFGAHYVDTDNAQVGGHVIPVLAKVGGYVTAINIVENQIVAAARPLLSIDARDFRARLNQAEAELAQIASTVGGGGQAVAQLRSTQAQAQAARAAVSQAEAEVDRSDKERERLRALLAQKLVSPQQFEAAEAAARTASARLQAAQDQVRAADAQTLAATAGLRGADARLLAAKAARDLAANQLADTVIRAPRQGVISQKAVDIGQLVQPGQPLMTLVPLDDVWIVANLKETQLDGLKLGCPAEVAIDAYPDQVWRATVESFAPATGAKFALLPPDNATGNFTKVVQRVPVRLRLAPGQHPERVLRPGMSAHATVSKCAR